MTRLAFTLEERARVDFVLTLRRRWADTLYPALTEEYGRAVEDADRAPASKDEAAPIVHDQPVYPWFAWTERGAQKMMWRTLADAVARQSPTIDLPEGETLGSIDLDPDLDLPSWYTDWDIHIQPGGIWRDDAGALVYEWGAKVVMLGDNDDYGFHRMFTDTAFPDGEYRRIVDLGCGFGKSTRPLKERFPEAEVIGVDLAAPCVKLAHVQAEERGLGITFMQRDCRQTGIEEGTADAVTGTMLIHEMPRTALKETIEEAARLLAPGGRLRILDFHPTGDPVRDLAMYEHGDRNNEPFMPVLFDTDVVAICEEAGLSDARWVAFDERGGGRQDSLEWPDRAEWHFPWAVLEAEKARS